MFRRMLCASLVLVTVVAGCAGPTKLAQRSEQKLAGGDIWRAWQLATRALDREPMNPRARQAAASAGGVISQDWQRRIHALAQVDSLRAAEQVLEFAVFRANAANYTSIPVAQTWAADELALRRAAANEHYLQGRRALSAHRPKAAFACFHHSERFIPGYRDAARLAEGAFEKALTHVAVLSFTSTGRDGGFGREVGDQWRDALADALAPPRSHFTRVLGADAVEKRMTVAQLGHLSRDEAWHLGRKSGAERVVWGSIGPVGSETKLEIFRERVARRIVQKGPDGQTVVRWVEVPIEVIARVRDVQVDVDYEVISTRDGTSLAHTRVPRSTRARVVWTSYAPEGDLDNYALVSEVMRAADPVRAKAIETRWKVVCGEGTTLAQVLAARRETRGDPGYRRESLGRFMAGAAFVFLQELPPAEDLALAAAKSAWQPLLDDLARLDTLDDVDLGVSLSNQER
ncbi:MAG: hypothetical protein ABIU54_00525 [Candidatus Eisenbacteria bacterium]